MSKLYGAAAKAVAKRARLARARKARARRSPVAKKRRSSVAPKRKNPRRRRRNPPPPGPWHQAAVAATASAKKAAKKRSAAAKKAAQTRKAKALARSTAAKKAAATRRRTTTKKRGKSMAAKRKKSTKRRKRTTKVAVRGRRARSGYRKIVKRSMRGRRRIKRKGVKALSRARHTVKYQRAYGGSGARRYLKKHRMRTNPKRRRSYRRRNPAAGVSGAKSAVVTSIKAALPIAISLYASRVISRKLLPRVPGLSGLGTHAAPVGAGLLLVLGHFATKKVGKLKKHRGSIMIGLGLNAVDVILNTYAPASVKAMVGLGDSYDALQQATGEFVETGEYLEQGDYISVGAEEELGIEAEMGMLEAEMGMGEDNIGTGIGTQSPSMWSRVASQAMVAPVQARSFTRKVRGVGPDYDSNMAGLYQGIFAGGF